MIARRYLASLPPLRIACAVIRALSDQFGLSIGWVSGLMRMMGFAREFFYFHRLNRGAPFQMRCRDISPCLIDRTAKTPVEPVYFLQDAWFAQKIAMRKPANHIDVGSSAKSMALIAQFVPITMVDIRPVDLRVPRFNFIQGSVLALPFTDGSVSSLSSLCVIEHVGLGRYGDPFDAKGSEKAATELCRILARGGHLYISVPVDAVCRVYFNAHRAFTRDYILSLFSKLIMAEERYIYGRALVEDYVPKMGFGIGLYHFRSP